MIRKEESHEEESRGGQRPRWARRADFSAIRQVLCLATDCGSVYVPNYLSRHIGIWNTATGKADNFIAVKGSSYASFSVELKIDVDEAQRTCLASYKQWRVNPYSTIEGYRVHLPETLSSQDLDFLRPVVVAAHRDWQRRHDRS